MRVVNKVFARVISLHLIDIYTQLFARKLTNQNSEYYEVNSENSYFVLLVNYITCDKEEHTLNKVLIQWLKKLTFSRLVYRSTVFAIDENILLQTFC